MDGDDEMYIDVSEINGGGDGMGYMNRRDGNPTDSGAEVLKSMGYMDGDGGGGMNRKNGDSTGSRTQVLKSVIIKAMVILLGLLVVLFLLMF
jgi:hypothetical protein